MPTSSENTGSERPTKPEEPPADLGAPLEPEKPRGALAKVDEPTPADLQVDSLQRRLEKTEDKQNEERWYILAGLCLLFDLLQFPHMGAVQATLIFALEMVVLLVMAERWGVDNVLWAMRHVGRFVRDIAGKKEDDKGGEE